jgi:FAD/FMN-containing dehydrogenase
VQVLYANRHDLPFLATSGKHGDFGTLQRLQKGVQVDLGRLNRVDVAADGKHATIGGGALTKAIIQNLAVADKRAVTGICECVGIGGAMLGGGHGFLQGQYGLMADQLIDATLVLANGTIVHVSEQSNPELFWALRGAGHNFGIVTELNYKIHDVAGHEDWAFEMYFFSGSQAEALFETINKLVLSQEPNTVHFGYIMNVPSLDTENAVFMWTVLHDGPSEALKKHTEPLRSLGPLSLDSGGVPYAQMARFLVSDLDSAPCQPGSTMQRFPVRLRKYGVLAMQKAYDLFNEKMKEIPALNNSMFALESYPIQGVKSVSRESTAYAFRDDPVLISPFLFYTPDTSLDALVSEWGEALRKLAQGDSADEQMHTYINYAHGSESLEAIYGHERWRLERLRRLKAEYDPEDRFSFYAPIH